MCHNLLLLKRISFILALVSAFFCFYPAPVTAAPVYVRILYVNDFHGYAEPYRPYGSKDLLGGISYLAYHIEELRKDPQRSTLLLAAGDMIQGNLWSNLSRGSATIELMNLMKFDAMVVGNHEFDFGQQALKERLHQADFPVLGANVSGLPGLKPYTVKNIGGVRIGILGIVTEQTPYFTHPDNVAGLTFMTPLAACQKYLDELKSLSDVVIVLSHIGFSEDRHLAAATKGIDVIIGGHSHTKVEKPVTVGKTMILQAWEHGKALGVFDLTLEDGIIIGRQGHLDMIKPVSGKSDPAVAALVSRYAAETGTAMREIFGTTCSDLDGESIRNGETNLGNLIADAMREAAKTDIALINAGSIRKSIKKGGIAMKDVYSVLPFDNYVIVMKLRGSQIIRILEHGVAAAGEGSGAFLQVSGLQFTYRVDDPSGNRVKEVRIGGSLLEKDREYKTAINDFMAAGGDGFTFLKKLPGEQLADKGQTMRELVNDYIRIRKEVCPKTEERIVPIK